jgi:hypothetical protein
MLNIRNSAELATALAAPLDPSLRLLLSLRCEQLLKHTDLDFGDVAQFLIIEPGDTLAAIEAAVGVVLTTNFVDGSKFGEAAFTSNFEFVARHPAGWFEAVLILSDDGFGVALFVPDRCDTDSELLALLLTHS